MVTIKGILTDVCNNYFKFQRFKVGPCCPCETCPGSYADGSKAKHQDVISTLRPYVIEYDPKISEYIYCQQTRVDQDPAVLKWNLTSKLDHSHTMNVSIKFLDLLEGNKKNFRSRFHTDL